MEECVAPEPTRFEILIHADQIALSLLKSPNALKSLAIYQRRP